MPEPKSVVVPGDPFMAPVTSTVTDPLKSKLVTQEKHPGGNASGISDVVPTELQLNIVKEIVPNLKMLGLVYDPSLDNARSTVESVKALAPKDLVSTQSQLDLQTTVGE